MANESTVEAARNRIQRLVEEIAALSKADITSEEFFKKFLGHAVSAADAKGGAIWLVGPRGEGGAELQLAAAVQFETSLFQSDELQRATILKILSNVIASKRPFILLPDSGSFEMQPPHGPPSPQAVASPGHPGAEPALSALVAEPGPGALPSVPPDAAGRQQTSNRTPFGFLHVPLLLKDQTLGVLQVWLQPYVAPASYSEFITFLSSLTGYVEQHIQSRRLGSMVVETQRLQHMLRFTTDLSGSLDPLEVSRLTANYARDLLGCERSAVLICDRGEWKTMAISGQETVESKSTMVKAITAFVAAHCGPALRTLRKKELLAAAEAGGNGVGEGTETALALRRTDEIDLNYFELSHVVSASVCPILNSDQEIVGALFSESARDDFFEGTGPKTPGELPPAQRMSQWMAVHAGRALVAARDYETLPLLHTARYLREKRNLLTGTKRKRTLLKTAVIGGLAVVILGWPATVKVDGDCTLAPIRRGAVVSEVAGRVESILVKEGDRVEKGQIVAELDKKRMETELQGIRQERLRALTDSDRYRAQSDEGSAQLSILQANIFAENEKRLLADIDSATLRAPVSGTVTTKDLQLHVGDYLQPGMLLAEVDDLTAWQVQMEVNEKDIGTVENALLKHGSIIATFILYSQSAHPFRAVVNSRQEISASAYPRDKQNVFLITVQNPEIPPDFLKNLRPGLTGRAKIELGRRPRLIGLWWPIARWFQMRFIG